MAISSELPSWGASGTVRPYVGTVTKDVVRVKLLEGKTALVTGVANRWSIATGIAHALHAHGARLAFIYQGERVKDEVEKLAGELPKELIFQRELLVARL